jgi:hypothetical protein
VVVVVREKARLPLELGARALVTEAKRQTGLALHLSVPVVVVAGLVMEMVATVTLAL